MSTGRLLNVRALDGDPGHDGYVLRTVGGVPVWMPAGVEGLTSTDASVTITDNGDGTLNVEVDLPPTDALVPWTTTLSTGEPALMWDDDDNLMMVEVPR